MRTGLISLLIAALALSTTGSAVSVDHAAGAVDSYCGTAPTSYTFQANDGWPMGFVWQANRGTLKCVQATSDRAPAGIKVSVLCGFNTTTAGQQLAVVQQLPAVWSGSLDIACPMSSQYIIIGVSNKYASPTNPITVRYGFTFQAAPSAGLEADNKLPTPPMP